MAVGDKIVNLDILKEVYDNAHASIENLENSIGDLVGTRLDLYQSLYKYDKDAWRVYLAANALVVGKKYKITLTPNTDFTCTQVQLGTSSYNSGVVDTLDTNVSMVSGEAVSYDYTPSVSGIICVRVPNQSTNFSSVIVEEYVTFNKTIVYTEDMSLTDSEKETARDNIGAASLADFEEAVSALQNTVQGTKKTVTGQTIFLSDKGIKNVSVPLDQQVVTVYGRNRFNINAATFSYSGYRTSHTLTIENNGIKVQCTVTQTGAYLNTYTEYTAEFTGKLFVSCEADTDGNIADVGILAYINGTAQTRLYGRGLLFEALDVTAGDTIRLAFYTHMGTSSGNTVYYKNIMLAYGGLYDFSPFGTEQRAYLPTEPANYTIAQARDGTNTWYKIDQSILNLPSTINPANGDTLAKCDCEGMQLVTYNETYNMRNGVGIGATGTIGIYYNGESRNDVANYVAQNNVCIVYRGGGSTVLTSQNYSFMDGDIIQFAENADSITYYCDDEIASSTVVCFGDSITGMFGNNSDYPSMLQYMYGLNAINAGFSGCRWTDHTNANYLPFSMNRLAEAIVSDDFTLQDASPLVDSSSSSYNALFAEHLSNIKSIDWKTVDYITLFWGTNDWGDAATLKSDDDTAISNKQRTNVEDAIVYTIQSLITKYPWIKAIVITPYWRSVAAGKDSNVDPNSKGDYLYQYADYIARTASNNFNIPIINLYRSAGVNAITNRYFTQDGTHPTEMLKREIAAKIDNCIRVGAQPQSSDESMGTATIAETKSYLGIN